MIVEATRELHFNNRSLIRDLLGERTPSYEQILRDLFVALDSPPSPTDKTSSSGLRLVLSPSQPFIHDFSRNREHPFTIRGSFNFSLPHLSTGWSHPRLPFCQVCAASFHHLAHPTPFRYWFTTAICKITPAALKLSTTAPRHALCRIAPREKVITPSHREVS